MNWDDVRIFLAVAEEGSFRRAAQKTKMGHSTLSRRIESLEDALGAKLFLRQSTGLTLTPAGEDMIKTAIPMQAEFSVLQSRLFGLENSPQGTIQLTVPSLLLNHFLLQEMREFVRQWPDIRIDINDTLDIVDLRAREADLAIRMTNHPGDELIGRRIGVFCEAVYASPSYLDGCLQNPGQAHRWVFPGGNYSFVANLVDPYTSEKPPVITMTVPDVESQRLAAELSVGIATLPCVVGDRSDSLKRISDVYKRSDIWLLAHKDTRGNKRMQIFREFLVAVFAKYEPLMAGDLQRRNVDAAE